MRTDRISTNLHELGPCMNIPQSVIGMLGELIPEIETHASIDSLFMYANAPGAPPGGNKNVKVMEWLRRCNLDPDTDALVVLKVLVDRYLTEDIDEHSPRYAFAVGRNERIEKCLRKAGLNELIDGELSPQSKTLEESIVALDAESINYEFNRAVTNADSDPFEAVSAASNILESTMHVLLEDAEIGLPTKKDLSSLWSATKSELGLDPSKVEDQDIQKIIGGLSSIVTGIAALRTHTSSAHGKGRFRYKLQKRHVDLSIHSAHALCLFIIETWKDRSTRKGPDQKH